MDFSGGRLLHGVFAIFHPLSFLTLTRCNAIQRTTATILGVGTTLNAVEETKKRKIFWLESRDIREPLESAIQK